MIELLDCTLRDGGYYTNWDFDTLLVDNYFSAMEVLPIKYIEIGYRSIPQEGYKGEFCYCPTYILDKARRLMPSKKIGVMLNEKETLIEDLPFLLADCKGRIDFVRMAVDPDNIERAGKTAKAIKDMGFEVGFNIMYMSKWQNDATLLQRIASLDGIADSLSMVDSFGAIFPDEVQSITSQLKALLKTSELGFHGHNNIELAFANTLTSIDNGCTIIDATITGMGRGAGNMKTELMLAYLSSKQGTEVDFNSLSNTVSDFEQLKEKFNWGTNLPYMVSGFNSLPQKDVMEWVTRRFYSINSILQALQNMKNKKGDNLKRPLFNTAKQQFDVALIIGGGKTADRHAEAIIHFLEKNKDKNSCIIHASSKNAAKYAHVAVPQFFCLVGNEGHRLEKTFTNFDIRSISCILPPYPRKMGTYIPNKLMDNSFELEKVTFNEVYTDSHTSLALQVALELQAKTIYIAGYDGYEGSIGENEKALTDENEYLFDAFGKTNPTIKVATITASKYKNIKSESLFGLLL